MQILGCALLQWKKKGVSSLELVTFIILIHLINAIHQTVHTGLSQQGEMTRPPWHSCFNHHLMQCIGKAMEFAAGEKSPSNGLQCWVRPGEELSSLMLLSPTRPHRHPARCVFWWCIHTSASLSALTHHYCGQNAALGPKPAKSRGRSWSKSHGPWRCCSAHWYSNYFPLESHIS